MFRQHEILLIIVERVTGVLLFPVYIMAPVKHFYFQKLETAKLTQET